VESKSHKTKALILKTAYELFSSNGYANTPISRILEKTGISKGGFYHHFKSKEEIIDTIARLQVDRVVISINKIAEEPLTALEKFNKLIQKVQLFRTRNRDQLYKLFEAFLSKENLVLKDKIDTYTLRRAKPVYAKIIEQGIGEGVFRTSSPELAAETIIRTAPELRMKMVQLHLARKTNEHYEKDIGEVADFLEEFVLKILGADKGSIQIAQLFKSFYSITD